MSTSEIQQFLADLETDLRSMTDKAERLLMLAEMQASSMNIMLRIFMQKPQVIMVGAREEPSGEFPPTEGSA